MTFQRSLSLSCLALSLAAVAPAVRADSAPAAAKPASEKPGPASATSAATPKSSPATPAVPDTTLELKAPLFSELFASTPVAKVGSRVITFQQLGEALAETHKDRMEGKSTKGPVADLQVILDRLIDMNLIVLEAEDMGMDEIPEVKPLLDYQKEVLLRETLQAKVTEPVKADRAEVDKLYKDLVREWKLTSLLFEKEDEAKKVAPALAAGKSFDALAKELVGAKKAKGGESQWVPRAQMLPGILNGVRTAKTGTVVRPIRVPLGWVVARVDDVRYPEDRAKREQAESVSLSHKQTEALSAFRRSLDKKYAKTDWALLNRLDYHAPKPGMDALLKDKRVISRIRGEPPVTVGDVTNQLATTYYHGLANAIREKQVNSGKQAALDAILYKRLFKVEALAQGVQYSEAYKNAVDEKVKGLLFGAFIQKAVVPDVKVSEQEGKKYYEEHKSEFTTPAFYRLEGVGFPTTAAAQSALNKLKAGTDLKWLKANAEGQLKDTEQSIQFEGRTLSANTFPPALTASLANAKKGDYRLYQASEKQCYVVNVVDTIPAQQQPYEEVKAGILNKLYGQNLNKAVHDWAVKLRAAHDVKVFVTKLGS